MSLTEIECPTCKGSGTVFCDECKNGSVWLLKYPTAKEEDPDSWETGDCPKCQGGGEIPCPECNGTKRILVGRELEPAFAR